MKLPNKTFFIFITVVFTARDGENRNQIAISGFKIKNICGFLTKTLEIIEKLCYNYKNRLFLFGRSQNRLQKHSRRRFLWLSIFPKNMLTGLFQ